MLHERGYLQLEAGRWVAHDLDTAPSTPGIDAVLGSRLDSLEELERIVIERAALVGKQFSLEEVLVLLEEDQQAGVLEALEKLTGKELLQEDGPGQRRFGFPHALIRDVAYQRITPEERARLHERYAEWRSASSPTAPATRTCSRRWVSTMTSPPATGAASPEPRPARSRRGWLARLARGC